VTGVQTCALPISMLAVNEDYYENLTKDKVEELINSLK
jgi:NADH:ubiquinone oxidoreductase subunit E